MTTFSVKKIAFSLICLLLLISIAFNISQEKINKVIECKARFSIYSENLAYHLKLSFFASDGKGLIIFSGSKGIRTNDIKIIKPFVYENMKRDVYVMSSNLGEPDSSYFNLGDDINDVLPSFFTRDKAEDQLIVTIKRIKDDAWLFMLGNTPYLLCEKNK